MTMLRGVAAQRRIELEDVQIWRTDLSRIDLERASSLLSDEEKQRGRRFRLEVHQRRYMAARSWMRDVLGEILGVAPPTLEFSYGRLGKPRLASLAGLCFNLSHSVNEAVLAVAWGREVGVDLEIFRADPLDPSAAAIVLSSDELAMVAQAPDADRALLRCWVRKEAYAKAVGGGLERHLATVAITTAAGEIVSPPGYQIFDVEDVPGVVLSVALAERSPKGRNQPGNPHTVQIRNQ